MKLSEELRWRGQIKDTTFKDDGWLDDPKTFYLGIDASADSLTIGNLAILMLVRRLSKAGWKPVLVMGGGTSLVGDPGGRTAERQLKSRDEIKKNIDGVRRQVAQICSGAKNILVDNYDWLSKLKYVDFLREVGKHFSMTELIQRDFVKERMGEGGAGISYAEFSYSLVQGYDYWHLYKNYGVVMQIGGSDQWGNMISGASLIRKKEEADVHALSIPLLINKTTGQKFGKSETGAIWLDPNRTSVYRFYQFWFNTGDQDVEDYLKIFTELDQDSVEKIMAEQDRNPELRPAQKRLALEVTTIVHGAKKAENVRNVSEALFGQKDYKDLSPNEFQELAGELPVIKAKIGEPLVDILVLGKLASSKTEAKRFLDTSAVYVNGAKISSGVTTLAEKDIIHGYAVVRRGRNESVLVRI